MSRIYARIAGIGHYVPPARLTNHDLERIVETSDQWITERSGIKERRIASIDENTSDLGYKSALKALKDAGMKAEDIDFIVSATNTPDMIFPATGCLEAAKLGLKAPCFDVQAGCPGVIYALEVARAFIESGIYRNVLVITSEVLSRFVNWKDRTTCVLFGDGAASYVLTASSEPGFIGSCLSGDGSLGDLLKFPAGGVREPASEYTVKNHRHAVFMQGREVFRYAVSYMAKASLKALERSGLSPQDIDWVVPHQANKRIIDATMDKLGLPHEKAYVNIDKYGNTSVATIGIALSEMKEKGLLKRGQNVLIVSFGAGFTWGAMVFRY